jgi:adenylate kinase
MLNIILMGPPEVGKGTQASRIVEKYHIPHISTGDMFREAIASGSELGKKVKAITERGDLVPDELTIAVVKERLLKDDCAKGYLLDGFPRTIPQAEALEKLGAEIKREVALVIYITAPDEVLYSRVSGRRVCPKCGASYNINTLKPKKEGICDYCGSPLIQRKDDTPEALAIRLANYYKSTAPLLGFYKTRKLLHTYDGTKGADPLFEELKKFLAANK